MVGQWSVERHQIPLSVYLRPAKGTVNPIRTLIRSLHLSDILPLLLQIFGNRAARADGGREIAESGEGEGGGACS